MKNTFKIPTWERDTVNKLIARYEKKANAYGKVLHTESGEPYVIKRKVKKFDPITKTVSDIGEQYVEVYDLTIESEPICKDGYSVVAKLEHLEWGNFVHTYGDEFKPEWNDKKSYCQHCNTKHYRKITFIVKHEDGSEKQVGSTCLKDYCGINPQKIGFANELCDLILDEDIDHYDFTNAPAKERVFPLDEVLALAYRVWKSRGYVKSSEIGSNKELLEDFVRDDDKPNDLELAYAREIIESCKAFTDITEDFIAQYGEEKYAEDIQFYNTYFNKHWTKTKRRIEWFTCNLRVLAKTGYCKFSHFGYIAYAPVAYDLYLEAKEEEERKNKENEELAKVSEYIGDVGSKVVVDVASMDLVTSWDTQFGRTFLYKIIDISGNVLIWYASRAVDEFKKFKATVKAHNERDGVKQTVVTRCFAMN